MNLREMGIPDACYFGCPTTDFRALEQTVTQKEADLTRAQEAGVSELGCQALQREVTASLGNAVRAVEEMPKDVEPGPWRATLPAEAPSSLSTRFPQLRCCRYAGVIVMDFASKHHDTYTIDRPRPASPDSSGDQG